MTRLPEHRQAQRAVEKASGNPKGWAIPVFCAAEFWAVATHPSGSPRPSQAEEARAFLAELCAAWFPSKGAPARFGLTLATS